MSGKKFLLNCSEAFRAAGEFSDFSRKARHILKSAPDGDGHPVIVLPGFLSTDHLTDPLRRVLKAKGYKTYAWHNNINLGLNEKTAQHLRDHLHEIYKKNGRRKVTLVGHSLGGIMARELAREFPHMVRGVISVGSPFGVGVDPQSVPKTLKKVFETLNPEIPFLDDQDFAHRGLTPPPVPSTSIFSKEDGIAQWTACLNPKTKYSENIEVPSSHVGLIWHSKTVEIILDRLAQPEHKWQPHKDAHPHDHPRNPNWKAPKKGRSYLFK